MMLGSAIETVYNLTDAFFLGRLGAAEIGAPSIAFSIVFFLTVFGIGLSSAGTTLIAQSKGKTDVIKMNHYMNQMASLLMTVSVILAIVGALVAAPILRLLNTPPDVYGFALVYMRIVFLGIPFVFMYFTLQASFTAIGDSLTPVKVHLIAVALNVVMDPILIFGLGPVPAMGVSGAAIATVSSQAIGALLSIFVLMRGRDGLKLSRAAMRPSLRSWGLLLRIGLPASVGQGLSSFGFTVLQGVVNTFGTAVIAAFGVGNRLFNMFNIPTHGIAGATGSLVGRAMGSKNPALAKRIVRNALLMVLVFELPLLSLAFLYGGSLVRLFLDNEEAIRLGAIMFKVVTPSLLMFSLFFALTGAFQGAGDTKIIMVLSIFRLWGVRVPLAFFLAFKTSLGPLSIWVAMFASNFLTAVIGFIYFKLGRWKHALDPDGI
jgi:putative MATE family efflux protein